MKKILVTGFEGFAGRTDNPAAELAWQLDGKRIAEVTIVSSVLPVTNHNLRANIVELIKKENPAIVLCLGLAAGESVIRIERLAANYSRFDIPDNAGEIYCGCVLPEGPAAYETTLPVEQLLEAVLRSRIPARLSHSAGTYLCNAVMYHALHYCSHELPDCLCGFVHLPYMPSQVCDMLSENTFGNENITLSSMALDDQKRAVMAMITSLVGVTDTPCYS